MSAQIPSIETTLPRPWEESQSFHDVLYDWMDRAPWLAISIAAHLLAFFVFQSIPWNAFSNPEVRKIEAKIQQTPEDRFEEPDEVLKEDLPDEVLDEPVPVDAEVPDEAPADDQAEPAETEGQPDFLSEANFDADQLNGIIGIGPGAGGKMGQRIGGPRGRGGGSGTEQSLKEGLAWLAEHQDADGHWDADGFASHCPPGDACDGPGAATHDVGLTGLALLAFLGDGHTTTQGRYRDVVARGVAWLKGQADRDSGLIGDDTSHDFVYDHAIATLALCEAYYFSRSPSLKRCAQEAVGYIARARDPYLAWRYDVPSVGDNDTSVTGWMVFALSSAQEAGLEVDPSAFDGALAWIDQVTDPDTGRVGYQEAGSPSSRTPTNEHYPRDKGEAMTAVGLLCRIFLHQDPEHEPVMRKHADLLRRKLPEWDPEGHGCDMYYWYYGTYAMYQMGGDDYWKPWNRAMKEAVLDSQVKQGHARGSWDPVGPWGYAGGRIYSTALMVLCLEVYFRYGRVLGAR